MNDILARAMTGSRATATLGRGAWLLLGGVVLILAWKGWAIWRLNINWDEFYFLSHIHALVRGDLGSPFQTAFTQVFRWLTWIDGGELPQIHTARFCMFLLMVLATAQVLRLAARWVSPVAAASVAIAFLCTLPALRHGASFRSDSLLLPVLLGTLLLLTRVQHTRRSDILAGMLCGLGVAISVKMALFAPLLAACVLFGRDAAGLAGFGRALARCAVIGGATLAVAAVLIGLHEWSLRSQHLEGAGEFASESLTKTVLETHFIPARFYLRQLLRADRFIWILIGVGALLALMRRRWQMAAMVLALLPILFYRNSFPYFYVLMLAPAVVVIGQIVDEVGGLARRGAASSSRDWAPVACGGLLLFFGLVRLPLLSHDEQGGQRELLAVVHRLFPQPVPYIDHSGMVSTFRKVNFFMSTWGMDQYQRRGVPFVRTALREHRPPLLIANRGFLDPLSPAIRELLPEDRELIQRFYRPYWGVIFIAGSAVELDGTEPVTVEMPFPGRYRLWSPEAVRVGGVLRNPDEAFDVGGTQVQVARDTPTAEPVIAQLMLAEAVNPPPEPPRFEFVYLGL